MSKELRQRLGVDDMALILQQNRLRWYGHVLRKDDVKLRVQDQGKTWKEDCQARKLNKENAVEGRRAPLLISPCHAAARCAFRLSECRRACLTAAAPRKTYIWRFLWFSMRGRWRHSIFSNNPERTEIVLGDSCCFCPDGSADFSSLIHVSVLCCVIRSSDELVFTSYVWQVDALTALCGVMAICVDTAMIMCSALIVDVICPSTVTRTLVSAVSRVLRNWVTRVLLLEISWTRLVYRQRTVQNRLIALSSRILESYKRSSKTTSVSMAPFAYTPVLMPSSRDKSKAACYKENLHFFECRSRCRLDSTNRPSGCRRRPLGTSWSLELSRQRLCAGMYYQVRPMHHSV